MVMLGVKLPLTSNIPFFFLVFRKTSINQPVQQPKKWKLWNFILKFIHVVFHEDQEVCDMGYVHNHSFVGNFAFISL